MAVEKDQKDEFSEGWDEDKGPTETPTEDKEEGEEKQPDKQPEEEERGEVKKPAEEPTPTHEDTEHKPWFETDPDLKPEHRQKIKSFNGMYLSEKKKRELLEEENRQLKASSREIPKEDPKREDSEEYDFDAAEERYADALIDGDKDGAKAIRREIKAKEKERDNRQAEQQATREVIMEACEMYPFLDDDNEKANKEAIDKVVALRNEFIAKKGWSFSKALEKAVQKVGAEYQNKEATPPAEPESEEEVKKLEVVRTRSGPISPTGKGKVDKNDFQGGWNED